MDKIIKTFENELKKLGGDPPPGAPDLVVNAMWFYEKKQLSKLIFAMKYLRLELNELKEEIKMLKQNQIIMENIIDIQAVKFGVWILRNTESIHNEKKEVVWRYKNYPTDYTTEELYQKFLDEAVEELNNEELSECCGAPIYEDTDICSECKEHI